MSYNPSLLGCFVPTNLPLRSLLSPNHATLSTLLLPEYIKFLGEPFPPLAAYSHSANDSYSDSQSFLYLENRSISIGNALKYFYTKHKINIDFIDGQINLKNNQEFYIYDQIEKKNKYIWGIECILSSHILIINFLVFPNY